MFLINELVIYETTSLYYLYMTNEIYTQGNIYMIQISDYC